MIKNSCINRILSLFIVVTLFCSSLFYQQKQSKSFLLGLTVSEFLFSMCASVLMTYCAYDIVDSVTDILTGQVDECLSNEEIYNNIASVNEPFFVESDKYSSFVLDENTINAINSILTSERMQQTISDIMSSNYYKVASKIDDNNHHLDTVLYRNYFSNRYGTIFNSELCNLYDKFLTDKFELNGITDKHFVCFGEALINNNKVRLYYNDNLDIIPCFNSYGTFNYIGRPNYKIYLNYVPFDNGIIHDVDWGYEYYSGNYLWHVGNNYSNWINDLKNVNCLAVYNDDSTNELKITYNLSSLGYSTLSTDSYYWLFYDSTPFSFLNYDCTTKDVNDKGDMSRFTLYQPSDMSFYNIDKSGAPSQKVLELVDNSNCSAAEIDVAKLSANEEVKALDYSSVINKTTEKIKRVAKDKTIPSEKVEAVKNTIAKQNEQIKDKTITVPSTIDVVTDVIAENVVANDIADDSVITDPSEPGNNNPLVPDVGLNDSDLTKVFPFCIPFDFVDMIQALQAKPQAPSFKFPMYTIDKNYQLKKTGDIDVDLSQFDGVASLFRNIMLLVFCIGLMLATKNLVGGGKS